MKFRILQADFILDSTGLAPQISLQADYDLIVENPPYGKLGSTSQHRLAVQGLGVDTPNLYAAFLALSSKMLRPGGSLTAITPRSFFNGPYFGDFRRHLLSSASIRHIHVFDSRSSVFADTGVLQENVILEMTTPHLPGDVALSSSRDHASVITTHVVPYSRVVYPNDEHQFIRIATTAQDTQTAERMLSQPCALSDLGVSVSTGKVVDFRSRDALLTARTSNALPIVYPGNVRNGSVTWPAEIRKPQWFLPQTERQTAMLMPAGWYPVVKRFSAKEERRRIVAGAWSPQEHPEAVAFENHLNVFHSAGRGLDEYLARGLCVWLNSTFVDRYFRIFSGHTQVNATDLRSLRYPAPHTLRELGALTLQSTADIDTAIDREVLS